MSGQDRSRAISRRARGGARKLPKVFGEGSEVLSGPGLGQGSGKVFGNIGGPVTLNIHCKESIVAGQDRSHAIRT